MEAAAHVLRLYLSGRLRGGPRRAARHAPHASAGASGALSLRSEEAAAEKRRVFAPGLKGWPLGYVLQLNEQGAADDGDFWDS